MPTINQFKLATGILLAVVGGSMYLGFSLRTAKTGTVKDTEATPVAACASQARAATVQVIAWRRTGQELSELGRGSGFLLKNSDLLVTAWHVIAGAEEISAVDADGGTAGVVTGVAGGDQWADLVLLTLVAPYPPNSSRPPAGLAVGNCAILREQEVVMVSAFPATHRQWVAQTGVFIGRYAPSEAAAWLQFDTAFTPGMSGAPALKIADASVVGIVSLTAAGAEKQMGFAVPSEALAAMLECANLDNPLPLDRWQRRNQQQSAWRAVLEDERYKRVVGQREAGNYTGALQTLETWPDRSQAENPWLLRQAAHIHEAQGNLQLATQCAALAAQQADHAMLWLEFARIAKIRGNITVTEYRMLVSKAVAASPGDAVVWTALAAACREEGDEASALKAQNRAHALHPTLRMSVP